MSILNVKKGASFSADPIQAVREIAEAIRQPDAVIVIFFASSKYDLITLEKALQDAFTCPVIGCTTSGEIMSSVGYIKGSIVGVSLSSSKLIAHPKIIYPLSRFDHAEVGKLAQELRSGLKLSNDFDPAKMFSLLLVDGLSMLEEQVVATLYNTLGGVNLFGGSAGDDLSFKETHVYCDSKFFKDAAVIALFETTLPFKTFHIQHFEPTDTRLVITESDCASRTVTEINGGSAAEEYASAVGLNITELNAQIFAAHPVMLKIGGEYYVRSIQKVNPDGSLTFYCAIDDGLVLTVGRGKDLVENLHENFANLHKELPTLKIFLGCDCIGRRLELQQKGLTEEAEKVLKNIDFIGFSTYGEQFNGIHINHTLTGIAIGE